MKQTDRAASVFRFRMPGESSLAEVQECGGELLGFKARDFLSGRISILDRIHAHDADRKGEIFSAGAPLSGSVCLRLCDAGGRIRCVQADYEKREGELRLELRDPAPADATRAMSSAYLRAALAHSDEETFFKSRHHVFIAASDRFTASISPWLRGRALVGLTDYDLFPESDADRQYRAEEEVLRTGSPLQEVFEIDQPGQSKMWVLARMYPVRDAARHVTGLFVISRNLTQGIEAEERQPVVTDPLTGKSKGPELGTYIFDIGRGVFATSANLDAILGIDKQYPHDLRGWEELMHPADAAGVLAYLQSVLEVPGRFFSREYRLIRKCDGEERWLHGMGRVVRDEAGQPLLMRGTVQDITARKQTEMALRETKERLQLFIDHAPAALAMFDREMRYLAISQRWLETYKVDITAEELLGRRHYDIVTDLPERWKEIHQRGLAGEPVRCEEDRFERADGSVLWLRWEVLPWHTEAGAVGGIILFLEDITRAKQAEERLHLAGTLFEQASEAFAITDLNGCILRVNEAFTQVTGYPPDEVVGRHIELLKPGCDEASFNTVISREVVAEGRWRGELWSRTRDGRDIPVGATVTTVRDAGGAPQFYVCMFFDISPIKEHERRLLHVARHDALTGLPNRIALAERLREAMQEARTTGRMLAVAAFDLDDFKSINDQRGKAASDSLLMNIASRMKQLLRDGDMLARPGGDEFVVVLTGLSGPESAGAAMKRLLQAVADAQRGGLGGLQVSATAGVAFYPQDEEVDADQLLRQADQAMYEAKLAGKNRYHAFDPVRDYSVRGRHVKLQEIEQALQRGEFVLYYQPKVDMTSGALMGAEALLRWQHPVRGLLLPAEFLPVIEEHDLSVAVGEWAIGAALEQMERWAQAGHRIRVSVNISARHLQQGNFIERLEELLHAHPGVEPARLGLEILETAVLHEVERGSRVIEACGRMGIRVAIDDFGTGYSSLTYLKRLPAPVLKIDQSFVRTMLEDPDDLAILQGVMGLANAFRRTAVAEGVETVEQGMLLLRMGCCIAQGFGIAAPMPAEELIPWFAAWKPDPRWKQVTPMSPADWPLLVAEVELRSWTQNLEAYFAGKRSTPPELDERECRFGVWISAEKLGPRGSLPILAVMDSLHTEAHEASRRALALQREGKQSEAVACLERALELRGQIQGHLGRLLAECGKVSPAAGGDGQGGQEFPAKLQ